MQMFVGVEPLALSLSMRMPQEAGEAFKSRGRNGMDFRTATTMKSAQYNMKVYRQI